MHHIRTQWNKLQDMGHVARERARGITRTSIGTIVAAVIILLAIWQAIWLNIRISDLSGRIATLETDFASTTERLHGTLSETQQALNAEKQNVETISDSLKTYRNEVGSITGTVETLEKLSKTDPELLQKYSKIFFLNEHYAPARLIEIPATYRYSNDKILKLQEEVWPHLHALLDRAADDKIDMYILSAYRSFEEQNALKSSYKITYGAGTANSFSADQGYSEHQLGTTVDIIDPSQKGVLEGFDRTRAYDWLTRNAYRYGFVLSYPKDNAYYVFEPWHWRFVGVKLATYLYKNNKHFYDLDQHEIDEYLAYIFE